jgi:hypothetical protein
MWQVKNPKLIRGHGAVWNFNLIIGLNEFLLNTNKSVLWKNQQGMVVKHIG